MVVLLTRTVNRKYHRLRVAASTAVRIHNENAAACDALIQHLDNCPICKSLDDFCEEARPLNAAYHSARLRTRVLGISIDEPPESGIEA